MATWDTAEKTGTGWQYNDEDITYSGNADADSENTIYYNSVGDSTTWTNIQEEA